MKKILLSAIICSIFSILGASAQTTQQLTASKANDYGLIYTLPSTAVDVTIEFEKTVTTPGEFFLYAPKLLGLSPIQDANVTFAVKQVILTSRGLPDNDRRYLVQFKAGATPFMILTDTDFPLAINTNPTQSFAPASLPESKQPLPTILQTPVAKQVITQEMIQSPSSAKRAELAAARIMELRQTRNEIIAGEADNMPSDGKALQLALDNLAQQEEALTAMFIGTTQTSTIVRTYTFSPTDSDSRSVIARLSAVDGPVDASNLSGQPIYLTYSITNRGQLPVNEKGEPKRFPKGGFAYCIPGSAQISISFQGNELASSTFDVAQLGVIFALEPNLFTDKKAPAAATLNPITGAIITLGQANN